MYPARSSSFRAEPMLSVIQVICYPTSPETVDITGFFEKFCIAIRTKNPLKLVISEDFLLLFLTLTHYLTH